MTAQTTSRSKFLTPKHAGRAYAQAGFTLIEIIVVIAIILGVLAVGAPRLISSSTQSRAEIRKMAVLTREIRTNARLFNLTSRLVLDMNDQSGHSYRVESASGHVTVLSEEMEKELERLTRLQRETEESGLSKGKFKLETRLTKKPRRLPKGLYIDEVEFGSRGTAITKGEAFIHFFAQGLAEEAVIHLSDRGTLNWTIAINPLTGRATVYERKVTLKEIRQQ
jgi:prepilin-type N-terminal cleavage/methylation domain-containing protein